MPPPKASQETLEASLMGFVSEIMQDLRELLGEDCFGAVRLVRPHVDIIQIFRLERYIRKVHVDKCNGTICLRIFRVLILVATFSVRPYDHPVSRLEILGEVDPVTKVKLQVKADISIWSAF